MEKYNKTTPAAPNAEDDGKKTPEVNEDIRVEWFGADGGLILLYLVLAAMYTYGILCRVDIIVGVIAPGIAFGITAAIFVRYCFEVFHFTKGTKKNGK